MSTLRLALTGGFLTAFLSSGIAVAAVPAANGTTATQPTEVVSENNKDENWYLLLGLGSFSAKYKGLAGQQVGSLQGVERASVGFDGGVYWPTANRKWLLGGSITYLSDEFKRGEVKSSFEQGMIAFSAEYFLTHKVGKGLFLRGDLGWSKFSREYVDPIKNVKSTEDNVDSGAGSTLGIGYAFPVSAETRINLGVNWTYMGDDRDSANYVGGFVSVFL